MELLTENGLFALPLYHATSNFFTTMIMKNGLGAQNIVTSWRVLDLVHELLGLIDSLAIGGNFDDDNFQTVDLLRRVSGQNVTAGGFNFRHGSVFLSAARGDALRYAANAKGSEILTMIHDALAVLPTSQRDVATDLLAGYPEVRAALASEHHPMIVTVQNVPIKFLQGERGGSVMHSIAVVKEFAREHSTINDVILQLCRFELLTALPPQMLSIESVSVRPV